MAKTIAVPEYLLKDIVRHYTTLSKARIDNSDIKAYNAKRMAKSEIARLERLLKEQAK